jgi:hypothetical protein
MIAKLKECLRLRSGEWICSFTTSENPEQMFDDLRESPVKVEIKKASKSRSLSANAYAWVLIDKISEKTGINQTDVYRSAIREIGGVSTLLGIKDEAVPVFSENWQRGHLGRQVEIIPGSSKPGWSNVRVFYGSSEFDSAQIARLIDSLIQDAEALGIPTINDEEAGRMISKWGKASSKETKDAISATG